MSADVLESYATEEKSDKRLALAATTKPFLDSLRRVVPPLDGSTYKGQSGKIAVLGGSAEYTGAPYFAAIAAMRAGAELSFVYTTSPAALVIKMYSPDLIVYPGFEYLGESCAALRRMHAIVVGPGLGRSDDAGKVMGTVLAAQGLVSMNTPVVFDADALWFLAESSSRGADLRRAVRDAPGSFVAYLTPNKVELDRLLAVTKCGSPEDLVSFFNGRIILVQKGRVDRVLSVDAVAEVDEHASEKRVGGQGDLLAGLLALFASWAARDRDRCPDMFAAAVVACSVTRVACRHAYDRRGRSLLASDILDSIGEAVDLAFPPAQ